MVVVCTPSGLRGKQRDRPPPPPSPLSTPPSLSPSSPPPLPPPSPGGGSCRRFAYRGRHRHGEAHASTAPLTVATIATIAATEPPLAGAVDMESGETPPRHAAVPSQTFLSPTATRPPAAADSRIRGGACCAPRGRPVQLGWRLHGTRYPFRQVGRRTSASHPLRDAGLPAHTLRLGSLLLDQL